MKDLVHGDLEGDNMQCVENSKIVIGSGPLISKAYIRLGKWMQQQEELVSKKNLFLELLDECSHLRDHSFGEVWLLHILSCSQSTYCSSQHQVHTM